MPGQSPQAGAPYPAPGQQYQQPGQPGMPQPQIPYNRQQPVPQYQPPKNQTANPDTATAPDAASTPYDFFMQQPKPAQAINPLPVGGKHLGNIPTDFNKVGNGSGVNTAGLKGKFPLIAGGGIALVLILFLVSALMPKDQSGAQLFGVAQIQQEVTRVCTQGTTKAKYRSTRFFAVTCSTGVYTNQKELLAYMSKQQIAFDAKQLGAKANATVDSKLKSAQSSSSYDATFREIVSAQLDSYDKALTAQLGVTTGVNAREILTKAQNSNQLLIKMVADDSDKTEAPAATEE